MSVNTQVHIYIYVLALSAGHRSLRHPTRRSSTLIFKLHSPQKGQARTAQDDPGRFYAGESRSAKEGRGCAEG